MDVRILLLSGFVMLFARSAHGDWFFRGTPNDWGKTAMTPVSGSNRFDTCQAFTNRPNPRFKIDRLGDWSESYPSQDLTVADGVYRIAFDALSHQISVTAVADCTPSPADTWFFQGTPHRWEPKPMDQLGDSDAYTVTVDFAGEDPAPRFKIDHFGNWRENYPAQDIPVDDCSRYEITFNRSTKAVDNKKVGPVTGGACSAGPIVVTASPPPGNYGVPQEITLAADAVGAVLYYTLDGSVPLWPHIQRFNLIRQSIPALQKAPMSQVNEFGSGVAFVRDYNNGESYAVIGPAIGGDQTMAVQGVRNGTYGDAVTGNRISVTGGTISFPVKGNSAAIYVLNGPGKIGLDGIYLR